MPGEIRMSAQDLQHLSTETEAQHRRVKDIADAIATTMSTSTGGTEFEGRAARSLQDLWRTNKPVLEQLGEDLRQWSGFCHDQSEVAARLNADF